MKPRNLFGAFFVLAAICGTHAADSAASTSRVEIMFVHPEKFTDCKDERIDTGRAREHILAEIQLTIEKLAARYLTEGQHLEIKVTDIDLAGDFEPWHNPGFDDIRYMRDVYPPRMELEFRLIGADGKVIVAGNRKLQQLGFMLAAGFPTSDPLRFDKEMVRDWFAREFKRSS